MKVPALLFQLWFKLASALCDQVAAATIDVPGFFSGGVKTDPLECQKIFSGDKVGGPGGK